MKTLFTITFVLDRPVTRTNALGEIWGFAYDLRDNRIRSTKPDGVEITASYDGLSRLTGLVGDAGFGGFGGVSAGAVTRGSLH